MKWDEIKTQGNSPGPRRFHSMIYYEPHNSLILFGGTTENFKKSNDIYEYQIKEHHWIVLPKDYNILSDLPEPSEACVMSLLRIF